MAEPTQWLKLPFPFVTPGQVFSVGLVFPLVCITLGGARLYVRHVQKQKLGTDDWLALLSIIMVTGMGICFMVGERLGIMGYPMPVPSGTVATEAYGLFNKAYETEAKIEFAFQFLQCFAFCFIKTSIVFFVRRIFVTHTNSVMNWASIGLIGVIVLWSVSFLMALIFGCGKNVAIHWAPLEELVASGCDGITPEKANLISDPILDFLILLFPIPSIWSLKMSTSRKWVVTAVFAIGVASCAAALTRLCIHITVLNLGYGGGYDINQTVTTIFYWSMVEGGLGVIVACLPALSVLWKEPGWLKRLLRRASSLSSLFRLGSWKSSGVSSNDEESRNKIYGVPMKTVDKRPTTESNQSQKELLASLKPNDSLA
ncbi:hypothetical protein BOTNAR_0159g00020 [Botryotinia narcissicola]|uniref:Rhodopsin domain-containing protein n=1 Tax=Botryotinia narcissicola TaxID=278944 RepID=A0A4Z1IS73_9HELO|nr:hypothetical protein BOTNAR_0159g00020 [Botryotinia narcissicola]